MRRLTALVSAKGIIIEATEEKQLAWLVHSSAPSFYSDEGKRSRNLKVKSFQI